jgi:hypothetical protein
MDADDQTNSDYSRDLFEDRFAGTALVVYESMFGDTRRVAEAIAAGLAGRYQVTVVAVHRLAPGQLRGVDFLVVGGPTHVRGMSRGKTRAAALDQAAQPGRQLTVDPEAAAGPGLREWFGTLTDAPHHAAAFDTRVQMSPLVTGRAAPKIARSLQRSGCHLIAEPESFLVTTKQPALVAGERERARAWGETLAVAGAQFLARSDA